MLCFVFVLGFSGCDFIRDFIGEDVPVPEESGNMQPYVAKGDPVPGTEDEKSIKVKFGVTLTGTEGVDAAFKELSAYIKKGGLDDADANVIKLGDWIDLEGGLEIGSYYGGEFSSSQDPNWNQEITVTRATESVEKLNRLIVVGINSFQSGRGMKSDNTTLTQNGDKDGQYTYPDGEPAPPPHVVFQFQNLLVIHGMSTSNSSVGGYSVSTMRDYLIPTEGLLNSGRFFYGLTTTAGVPKDVLWAPARKVSATSTYSVSVAPAQIQDMVWLPTEWEMLGKRLSSVKDETAGNQARLEFYTDQFSRYKFDASKIAKQYWLASQPNNSNYGFCIVRENGSTYSASPPMMLGVSPAFCVYGGPQQ
jgi:hypothetical protein